MDKIITANEARQRTSEYYGVGNDLQEIAMNELRGQVARLIRGEGRIGRFKGDTYTTMYGEALSRKQKKENHRRIIKELREQGYRVRSGLFLYSDWIYISWQ